MARTKKPVAKKTTTARKNVAAGKKARAAKANQKASADSTGSDTAAEVDRRSSKDRRTAEERRKKSEPVKAERRKLERRAKVNRRRQIDPTTCERDYTDDEIEFMNAMEEYKRASGRMFPTCSEILEVVRKLGYQKCLGERPAAAPVPDLQVDTVAQPLESVL